MAGTDIDCTGTTVSDPNASGNPYQCEGYRLPTEAEWEYAYRAGTTTAFHNGGITNTAQTPFDETLDDIGWYGGNSGVDYDLATDCLGWYTGSTLCGTHEVGGKLPNDWGLFDMAGNVYEWVWDQYRSNYYSSSPSVDPLGGSGSDRVGRGGSWGGAAKRCRAANRRDFEPGQVEFYIGFRPVRTIPAASADRCFDLYFNGDETGVDCGGSCGPC